MYPDRNGFMPYETGYDQRMASPSRSSVPACDMALIKLRAVVGSRDSGG